MWRRIVVALWLIPALTGFSNNYQRDISSSTPYGVLIQTLTAASSANLQFTGISGYNTLRLTCTGIVPATSGAIAELLVGTGGGPSWTSSYQWLAIYNEPNATTPTGTGSNSATSLGTGQQLATTTPLGIDYVVYGASDAADPSVRFSAMGVNTTPSIFQESGGGFGLTVGPVTGLQFLMSTGNIASGRCSLYGLEH